MARHPYDPLTIIPTPDVIRAELTKALTLADRLRILLDVAERLRVNPPSVDHLLRAEGKEEVSHV